MGARLFIACLLLLWVPVQAAPCHALPEHPFVQLRRNPEQLQALSSVIAAVAQEAYGKTAALPASLPEIFSRPQAIFITLKKQDRVYGCMGTLQARGKNLLEEIQLVLPKSLFQDPRHPPVAAADLPGMEVYLSAVGKPVRVGQIEALNPARDGVMIQNGNKVGVVLPGEAKTLRYLLSFAKAKAGIGPDESYQVYRLPTETVRVILP